MSDLLQIVSERKSLTEPYVVSCCRSSLSLATASEAESLDCALSGGIETAPSGGGRFRPLAWTGHHQDAVNIYSNGFHPARHPLGRVGFFWYG
jgi:hypothetical protein